MEKFKLTIEFTEPPLNAFKSSTTTNVINNECTDYTVVVSRSDDTEALLTGAVPDLSFDFLIVDINDLSLELDTVALECRSNSSLAKQERRSDFLTAESPTTSILKRYSSPPSPSSSSRETYDNDLSNVGSF